MKRSFFLPATALVTSMTLVACGGTSRTSPPEEMPPEPPQPLVQGDVFLLTADHRLVTLDRDMPTVIKGEVEISGLPDDEQLLGMDFRPATGELYALGNSGTLFLIDNVSGEVLDSILLTAAMGMSFAGLEGEAFGVGFNPVPDRLRVTSDTGQNLRINVDTGETIVDGELALADDTGDNGESGMPENGDNGDQLDNGDDMNGDEPENGDDNGDSDNGNGDEPADNGDNGNGDAPEEGTVETQMTFTGDFAITASSYTNSFAGTVNTRLFNLDSVAGLLYQQLPPNDGVLTNAVPLGVQGVATGFAIDGTNNSAFATLNVDGADGLYSINLNAQGDDSAAMLMADLALESPVIGIALPPATVTLVALTRMNELAVFGLDNVLDAETTLITGLEMTDEQLIGIDVRPATGDTYVVSNMGNVYTVDLESGEATFQSQLVAAENEPFVGLEGTDFALDFNPVPDRLRLISNTGQNLRINVDTGETIVDGDIAFPTEEQAGALDDIPLLGDSLGGLLDTLIPDEGEEPPVTTVTGAAYTNSFAGTASTQLFTLDVENNAVNLQVPPNDGVQVPLEDTPIAIEGDQAFDIAGGDNGLTVMALTSTDGGPALLYRVNINNLSFELIGDDELSSTIGGDMAPALRGLTIVLQQAAQ